MTLNLSPHLSEPEKRASGSLDMGSSHETSVRAKEPSIVLTNGRMPFEKKKRTHTSQYSVHLTSWTLNVEQGSPKKGLKGMHGEYKYEVL